FSQSGHAALLAALVLLATGQGGPFAPALLGMSVAHHVFSYAVLRRLYRLSVPQTRSVAWFPLANLVMDYVLIRAIKMCLTGRVTWRGTVYEPAAVTKPAS
ncbi:MAG: glycosyl transferase family 2, partial [Singulisphaera sp.]|nr:glycosyl transferase family 2 [Singulisphaera sp.]